MRNVTSKVRSAGHESGKELNPQVMPETPASTAKVHIEAHPLSCVRLLDEDFPSQTNGRVMCSLQFTDFFNGAKIKETLMIVDTNEQPFDGYLWHRCVVFGRFEKVITQHLDAFDGTAQYDRALLMVRGNFANEWQLFKRVARERKQTNTREGGTEAIKQGGILLWADEKCEPTVDMREAKFAFRHYGCVKDSAATYIPNGFWRWKFGKAPPLGAREQQIPADSSCEGSTDIIKASARRHFFNWQGTIRRRRREMVSSAQRQYKTSTSKDARYYLSPRGSGFDGDGPSFQDAIANSAFTLCPCGNNAETHRLWEALVAGSIPVQEDCGDTNSQTNFLAFVRKVLPEVIFIKDWNQLRAMLDPFEKDQEALNRKQQRLFTQFVSLMTRVGKDAGDIVTGAGSTITWPNAAVSA